MEIQPKVTEPVFRGRIGRRLVLSFVLLVMIIVGGTGWVLYKLTYRSLVAQMSTHLVSVAQVTAAQVTAASDGGDLLRRLRPGWESFRFYRNLTARLSRIQELVGARRIYVFDRRGRSLLDTESGTPIGTEYHQLWVRDRSEVERVWGGEAVHSVLFPAEDVYYMTGYAPIYSGGERVAAVGVDIGAGFMGTIRVFERSVYIFGAVSVLLTVVVGLGMARTITRPIQRLVRAAREIGRGDLGQAVGSPANNELGYLGYTMEEMRRKLLARDAQLRQMLGGVAHEMRNPLGGIEIYAGLIADDLPDGDPRKAHIQKVIGEVRNLNKVITEFLDFARPAPPEPEAVEIDVLVEEAAFILGPEMQAAGVEYEARVEAGLCVFADAEQLRRALLNLIKNAVQAMPDGGRLEVRGESQGGEVVVSIEDSGPGMDEETRARLFEPFFTTKEKGSGLGLAIVQQALEVNGGRVEVGAGAQGGTVFTLSLPPARAATAAGIG
jgi:signal transduction histidine kinase